MLINLVSQSNYQSYNIYIAKAFGLKSAVYLNALIEINEKAIRKNKLVNDHFLIDRKYITDRTTLTKHEQKQIENNLEVSKVINKIEEDYIKVNIDVLSGIMMSDDENIIKDLSYINKAKNSKDKKSEAILSAVKKNVNKNYPQDLKQAYYDWLDVVQNKFGFVSKQMVLTAQNVIDKESNHEVDKAIDIINIASSNGWKDMYYAVKIYNDRHTTQTKVTQNDIKISQEQF